MLSKLDQAKSTLEHHITVLRCNICHKQLQSEHNSIKCENNHTFNINKKGIVSMDTPMSDKIYNKQLFESRKVILNSHIFQPIHDALSKIVKDNTLTVLDVGCGEATYLNKLKETHTSNQHIGIDLSKDGLNIASNYEGLTLITADLANIPIESKSVDVILNILSPANYEEFNRVLKDDGILIKVIVERDYLKELREATEAHAHSNENVISLLENNMQIISNDRITYTLPLTEELSQHIINMTPLTNNRIVDQSLSHITIDYRLVVCHTKKDV